MTPAPIILVLVTVQRLGELALSRRNTRRLLHGGGIEVAPDHYAGIVACHTLWLASLWLFGWGRPVEPGWLGVFVLLQAMRVWILATLRSRWTTRIIVVPGETLVARGPYLLLRHPNYAVVAAEIAVLPTALGLPIITATFTLFNAVVLFVRIRAESGALYGS